MSSGGALVRSSGDQALELVEDVLHSLPGQGIHVGRAGDTLDERDHASATAGAEQSGRARHPEDPPDLLLRCRPQIAARAQAQVASEVELDRFRRHVLGEQDAQQRRGGQHVGERLVRALERDPASLADRLEAMIRRERLEHTEGVERAGDSRRPIDDPDDRERLLEHRQVEARIVSDEDRIREQRKEIGCDLGEAGRLGDIVGADPVHGRGLRRDRPQGSNQRGITRELNAIGVKANHGERNDLVRIRARPGRLAVEGCADVRPVAFRRADRRRRAGARVVRGRGAACAVTARFAGV